MTLPDYAIEIEGLRKTYAGTRATPPKEALKGIDLKVRRWESDWEIDAGGRAA